MEYTVKFFTFVNQIHNYMGKVICFANNKGGCAKTTSIYTIAQVWARAGKKILLIDLDSQANLTSIITHTDSASQRWESTIEDAFLLGPEGDLPIYTTPYENIEVVPADLDLSNFERETARHMAKEHLLSDLVAKVKDNYDYVMIDCPPSLGQIVENGLIAADFLVIPTTPDGLSYKGVEMISYIYNEIIKNPHLSTKLRLIGILITKYEKSNVSDYYVEQFMTQLGKFVIQPVIHKSTKLIQSASFQNSIFDIDPKGRAAKEYQQVAQELLTRIEFN